MNCIIGVDPFILNPLVNLLSTQYSSLDGVDNIICFLLGTPFRLVHGVKKHRFPWHLLKQACCGTILSTGKNEYSLATGPYSVYGVKQPTAVVHVLSFMCCRSCAAVIHLLSMQLFVLVASSPQARASVHGQRIKPAINNHSSFCVLLEAEMVFEICPFLLMTLLFLFWVCDGLNVAIV